MEQQKNRFVGHYTISTNFGTKHWFETNDDLRGTYNINSQIESKTTMSKSRLCYYSDAH